MEIETLGCRRLRRLRTSPHQSRHRLAGLRRPLVRLLARLVNEGRFIEVHVYVHTTHVVGLGFIRPDQMLVLVRGFKQTIEGGSHDYLSLALG